MAQTTIHTSEVRGLVLNNYDATAAPSDMDDSNMGYSPGSIQIYRYNEIAKIYICVDSNEYNAIQEELANKVDAPSVVQGIAVLDFGPYPGSNIATAIIGDTGIVVNTKSEIHVQFATGGYDDNFEHTIEDHLWASLFIKLTTSPYSVEPRGFIIYGISEHQMQGMYVVYWTVSSYQYNL